MADSQAVTTGAGRLRARSRPLQVYAAVGGAWGASLATQYAAACLRYHPNLGPWLYGAGPSARVHLGTVAILCLLAAFVLLPMRRWRLLAIPLVLAALTAHIAQTGPLYSPSRIFVWYAAYHGIRQYREMFLIGWLIIAVVTLALTIVAVRVSNRADQGISASRSPARTPSGGAFVGGRRIGGIQPRHLAASLSSGIGPFDGGESREEPLLGETDAVAGTSQ